MSRFRILKKAILSNSSCPLMESRSNTLNISVNNINDVISPYSEDNKEVINNEFANFLENAVKDTSIKEDLTLEISCNNCHLNTISSAIKNYYYNEFVDCERKLKQNLTFSIFTFIIGLLALACTIILNSLNTPFLISGAVDIFAWVFAWESIDLFFFKRAEIKYNQYRFMNFINCNIILK